MSDTIEAVADESSPAACGRELALARERMGLSIGDVARHIKLAPRQVQAIEAGDFERLPGGVFLRGFIRNYARTVNLDPAALLAQAESQLPRTTQNQAADLSPSVNIPFPTRQRFNWHKPIAVLGVLLVPVLISYFYGEETSQVTVKSRQMALPLPPIVPEQHPQGASSNSMPAATGTDAPSATADNAAAPQSAETVSPGADRLATAAERKREEHQLKLSFARESWVEIRDGNGRKIFSQLNPAGTEQAVSGLPPLSLVVGNAGGVHLNLNDQPVDLAPYIKVDVARLTLE